MAYTERDIQLDTDERSDRFDLRGYSTAASSFT